MSRKPYEITADGTGVNIDIADELYILAANLPVYKSSFARPFQVETPDEETPFRIERHSEECIRCADDDMVIWPDTPAKRIGHLTRDHGYRMNGLRYTNDNTVVA